jgi:D-alanyl-lipoteichoic acid acyltransferase DltB (MBOAT superfamily)
MVFNSASFFVFISIIYLLYRCLGHRGQNILLLVASYFFYAWWDARFLFLTIASTSLNYCCGLFMAGPRMSRKEQATAASWVVVSCFILLTLQWQSIPALLDQFSSSIGWQSVSPSGKEWLVLSFVIGMVALFNVMASRIASLGETKRQKVFLIVAVVANLAILGFFKYYNFFIDSMAWLIRGVDSDPSRYHLDIVLPIGISFYTFKAISYCVDTYQGKSLSEHNYVDFAAFIAFFPALLAGPIDRASGLLRQFNQERRVTVEQTLRGLHLFFYGFFKKVVIADGVARTVNSVFGSTGHVSWIDVVIATFFFTIQIYCDFSGYTDMARGVAKLFGFNLMINFRFPYFSQGFREFWSRWHISLSTWLRDYLYIPLGGNRHGEGKTYRNLMITMVLGGLWHGAAWNFVLWGFYHGLLLCLDRGFQLTSKAVHASKGYWIPLGKAALCFLLTCYGWMLFRAPSFDTILNFSTTLLFDFGNLNFGGARPRLAALCGLPLFLIIEAIEGLGDEKPFYEKLHVGIWSGLYASLIFSIAIGLTTESVNFIYMVF